MTCDLPHSVVLLFKLVLPLYIAEVNTDKFGCYTPGTLIPIISEQEARKMNPDYFFVLPWHFKEFILKKEKTKPNNKTALLFPLPSIETYR